MSPYLMAFEEYEKCDRGVSWTEALELHLQRGAVVSTPAGFVMVRPVYACWRDEAHLDLGMVAPVGRADCWHVWAAAGDLRELLGFLSREELPWLSFQRHGGERLHRMRTERLKVKAERLKVES